MSRTARTAATLFAALSLLGTAACSGEDVNEWGQPTLESTGYDDSSEGKADGVNGRRGLPTSLDGASTEVWEVKNSWRDTDTANARKAGPAWGADSGLNWDEKYRVWVESLEKIDCDDCWGETFLLTTPYGTTLPSPSLECAEQAMFLRIAFASWYKLPFFMEAADGGKRLFFGHFGVRTEDGRWGNMPNFRTNYPDFSDMADEIAAGTAEWPTDSKLANKKIYGSFDDEQPMIGEDAHAGAYFDALFLNKRVGHFLMLQLTYFGSVNLADSANLFNVHPDATDAGDVLVKRYGREGIGHTYVVKHRENFDAAEIDGETVPQFELHVVSGSMPRRQPQWEEGVSAKSALSASAGGGPEHGEFGGGIKRWRTAVAVQGAWTNVVLPDYAEHFVRAGNLSEIEARPARFAQILTELSPELKLEQLLRSINTERAWLSEHPSSCSARERREVAFEQLYALAPELGKSRADMDREHRTLEDYVFAEMNYEESKVCCWNSSTAAMYEIVMDYNREQLSADGECRGVTVFHGRDDDGDGFDVFRAYAESTGRGGQWVAWSADEHCPQAEVAADSPSERETAVGICEQSF